VEEQNGLGVLNIFARFFGFLPPKNVKFLIKVDISVFQHDKRDKI